MLVCLTGVHWFIFTGSLIAPGDFDCSSGVDLSCSTFAVLSEGTIKIIKLVQTRIYALIAV